MRRVRVVVVGAGVGGSAAAIALARDGHDVQVVERARRMTAAGAGIGLWPNAVRALDELGLGSRVGAVGHPFAATRIRDSYGRVLSSFDPGSVVRRLGGQPLIAHRAELHAVLMQAAAGVPLRLGVAATGVSRPRSGCPRVELSNGEVLEADLVVGADGVRSVVRRAFDGSTPRASKLLSWRAVLETGPMVDDAWLSIGGGQQFLATPMTGGRTYLAGLLGPVDGRPPARSVGTLVAAHGHWHRPIPELLSRLADTAVRWDPVLHRRPPRTLSDGPVVLIGDAAHPMTPDLGQGGCQAIEDGVVLSLALRRHPDDVPSALQVFDRVRRRRVRRVVNDSRRVGRVLAIGRPTAAAVRNHLIRMTPAAVGLAQLTRHAGAHSFERQLG